MVRVGTRKWEALRRRQQPEERTTTTTKKRFNGSNITKWALFCWPRRPRARAAATTAVIRCRPLSPAFQIAWERPPPPWSPTLAGQNRPKKESSRDTKRQKWRTRPVCCASNDDEIQNGLKHKNPIEEDGPRLKWLCARSEEMDNFETNARARTRRKTERLAHSRKRSSSNDSSITQSAQLA